MGFRQRWSTEPFAPTLAPEDYRMTEAERFTFDLSGVSAAPPSEAAARCCPLQSCCGRSLPPLTGARAQFLVRPAILSPEQVAEIREQVLRIHRDPMSLPPEQRHVPGGPSSLLVDHPAVLGVVEEIIGKDVRIENPNSVVREQGEEHGGLHGGGPTQIDPIFGYRPPPSLIPSSPLSAQPASLLTLFAKAEHEGAGPLQARRTDASTRAWSASSSS